MENQPVRYFILGVMTLTDARYFTALGVDYLHFDFNPDSLYPITQPAWEAIVEWVEGSDIICSFDHLFDEEQIRKIIEHSSVAGVLSRFPDMLDYVHRMRPELQLFQQVDDVSETDHHLDLAGIIGAGDSTIKNHFHLCEGPLEAQSAVKQGKKAIAIHPGTEDEVGIKDFEAYDRLIYQEF